MNLQNIVHTWTQKTTKIFTLIDFKFVFHYYVQNVQDERGDGNYGFRTVVVCLGLHQDKWSNFWCNILDELNIHIK